MGAPLGRRCRRPIDISTAGKCFLDMLGVFARQPATKAGGIDLPVAGLPVMRRKRGRSLSHSAASGFDFFFGARARRRRLTWFEFSARHRLK
jgi:hypothetical protein